MRTNPSKMRKAELVEIAVRECNLTPARAENLTVPSLRELVTRTRKHLKGAEDPMKKRPPNFSNMDKEKLIVEAKKRSLIVDQINPNRSEWKKLTHGELKLAIENHIAYSKGLPTVIKSEMKNASENTNVISSDEELQELRMPVEETSASPAAVKAGRRKREK